MFTAMFKSIFHPESSSCVLKKHGLFWVIAILPLLLIMVNEVASNGFALYEHIAQPEKVIFLTCAFISFALSCWGWTWYHKKLFFPKAEKLWQIYVLSALMCLCGCTIIYLPDGSFPVACLSAMGTTCILWALFKRLSFIFWFPFMFVEMLQLGAHIQYGTMLNNPIVLAEIFEASNDEILGYVTLFNGFLAILLLAISWAFCAFQAKVFHQLTRLSLLNAGTLSLLIAAAALHIFHPSKVCIDNIWPTFELTKFQFNINEATSGNDSLLTYVSNLPSPSKEPSSLSTIPENAGVVLVLHIGESVRADRLGLNGYRNCGKDTTPWLSSQLEKKTLINYKDCISSAPMTCNAMITLLTDARRSTTEKDHEYGARAGSVLELFADNHFPVYAFFGKSTGRMVKSERVTRALTRCARESHWSEGLPKTAIPKIATVIQNHPTNNLLVYINNEGSHAPFRYYDIDSAVFTPSRPSLSSPSLYAREVNNAYDNTIRYTDEFIRMVAEQLQGRPFVYVYVSDHGEWLGHDGIWGRGGVKNYHSTTGCRVGMFIIVSPEFEALHPHFAEAVNNLRANASMTVGHEHLYHTLLGLIGIKSPLYNQSLDLSSQSPEAYSGPHPDKG